MLYTATIFASAFLLFLVQPIIAKLILPWFGGTAAVWTVCLVFFQVTLLAGYLYADALSRLRMKRQALVHTVLVLAACACLPILPSAGWKPEPGVDPTGRILLLLVATIGLPYLAVCTTGPLVQNWFARVTQDAARRARVYRLFALSNLASLAALVAYPLYFERVLTLRVQGWGWSAGFLVFAVLAIGSAWWTARRVGDDAAPAPALADDGPDPLDEPPGLGAYLQWLLLAGLGTVMLLAVTTHITQDVASVPFLWILPLALYLLSFILAFERDRWYLRGLFWPALALLLPAMAWMLSTPNVPRELWPTLALFSGGLFVVCMFCHGELARGRPDARWLTRFYLMVSVGGALGGLFVGLVAPRVFSGSWELPLAMLACLAMLAVVARGTVSLVFVAIASLGLGGYLWLAFGGPLIGADTRVLWGVAAAIVLLFTAFVAWRQHSARAGAAMLAGLACASCAWFGWTYVQRIERASLLVTRNFYGVLRVAEFRDEDGHPVLRQLTHGVIRHGVQYLAPELRDRPTTYYGEDSGAGLAIAHVGGGTRRIGVIGLGAGTLAAYGVKNGTVRFYEINPSIVEIARTRFSYLADSRAQIEVVLGDARLSLEREAAAGELQNFDVLVVDAFSSDSIPVHLITREALAVYERHLRPGGVIAFHVSNRFLDLPPVVEALARDAGLKAVLIADKPGEDRYWLHSTSYVLVTGDPTFVADPAIATRATPIRPRPDVGVWTDDYNNLVRILR